METSLYSFYLRAPKIENPYYETKSYKFSEKVVTAQDDATDDDKRPSRLNTNDIALNELNSHIDDVALQLNGNIDEVTLRLNRHIDDVALQFDKLTRLVEKMVDAS